jgi:hypothetical protein
MANPRTDNTFAGTNQGVQAGTIENLRFYAAPGKRSHAPRDDCDIY